MIRITRDLKLEQQNIAKLANQIISANMLGLCAKISIAYSAADLGDAWMYKVVRYMLSRDVALRDLIVVVVFQDFEPKHSHMALGLELIADHLSDPDGYTPIYSAFEFLDDEAMSRASSSGSDG